MKHRNAPADTRRAFRAHPAPEALALDPGGAGLIAAALRGEAPPPAAFGFFCDLPGPLAFDPEAIDEGIAVLCLSGPIEHHDTGWWHSYEALAREVECALEHPEVRGVILKIDSPGGVAAGMGETHKAIRSLRKKYGKPILAFADEMACSAAYHLASACDEVWTTEAGHVGSVGVILCTVDETKRLDKEGVAVRYLVTGKRKADLHPGAPVTDDVIDVAQAKVDKLGAQFFAAVGKARGMSPEAVEALQAAVFVGDDAVRARLADGVAGWAKFLRLAKRAISASAVGARTENVRPPLKDNAMAKILKLTKALDDAKALATTAEAAHTTAPTPTTRATYLGALLAVIGAAQAVAKADASTSAKMTKIVEKYSEKKERMEDDGAESGEEEEEDAAMRRADAEESSDMASSVPSTERSSDAKSSEEEEEEEEEERAARGKMEEEEEEKATAKAWHAASRSYKANAPADAYAIHGPKKLLDAVKKATGAKTVAGAIAALGKLRDKSAAADATVIQAQAKLTADVERLKADGRKQRVDAIVSQAKTDLRAGATTKEGRAALRTFGMEHGTKKLAALIDAMPKIARGTKEGFVPRAGTEGELLGGMGASADEEKILASMTAGMTPEAIAQFRADFAKRKANGAAARTTPRH